MAKKAPAPEKVKPIKHTPQYTFQLVEWVEPIENTNGHVSMVIRSPETPTFVIGVTWFRCRAFMGTFLGVDAAKVVLEMAKHTPPGPIVVHKVPDK